jgi:hypothetical protein
MIDARKLQKYTKQDHAIHLFLKKLDKKLREYTYTNENAKSFTVVIYNSLKEQPGFFSPKSYEPKSEEGVNFLYKDPYDFQVLYFEKLVDAVADYGYNLHSDQYNSNQFNRSVKLIFTW